MTPDQIALALSELSENERERVFRLFVSDIEHLRTKMEHERAVEQLEVERARGAGR